jgi:DNA-binding HxlR family transcriptional regulator
MTTTKPPVDDQGREFDVFDPRCPSRTALHDVTNKWAPLILITLDDGAGRFGEIHRAIGGSRERMISQTLSVLAEWCSASSTRAGAPSTT